MTPKSRFIRIQTRVRTIAAREKLQVADFIGKTDSELLAMADFGPGCLGYVRGILKNLNAEQLASYNRYYG